MEDDLAANFHHNAPKWLGRNPWQNAIRWKSENQMDIFPYLLGVLLTVVAAYWFVANVRRPSGSPTTGLFRYHETLEPPAPGSSESERPARYRARPVVGDRAPHGARVAK